MEYASIGVMGKHPGYGDFVQAGMSTEIVEMLNTWLDAVLPPLRDQMGQEWAAFWDGAQDVRFWIGRAVLGKTLCGVLRPSRDRVGRRYPLILAVENVALVAPLGEAADQAPWEALAEHLDEMAPGQGGKALLEGLEVSFLAEEPEVTALGPTLWAHHPKGDLEALLQEAEAQDALRAQISRSYWWAPGQRSKTTDRAATWLACQGLPASQALGWILGGVRGEADE